jgi:hypothetical protein
MWNTLRLNGNRLPMSRIPVPKNRNVTVAYLHAPRQSLLYAMPLSCTATNLPFP